MIHIYIKTSAAVYTKAPKQELIHINKKQPIEHKKQLYKNDVIL